MYQFKGGKLEYVETLGGASVTDAVKDAAQATGDAAKAVAGAAADATSKVPSSPVQRQSRKQPTPPRPQSRRSNVRFQAERNGTARCRLFMLRSAA
jgi:hypothetical protein